MIHLANRKIIKVVTLKDGNGHKLNRKIHRDDQGLYVINHGMKGRLTKAVSRSDITDTRSTIIVRRTVTSYTEI